VRALLRRGHPGPYQVQAAIQAVHADAATAGRTDWSQILDLYDLLLTLLPRPVVALNRAMAVAEVFGPEEALAVVEGLDLPGYQPYHAVRADLLERTGRPADAVAAYDRALELTVNPVEQAHLQRRRRAATG
jgi:RNA polymerase sigma-70 factor (ECF subfamily)